MTKARTEPAPALELLVHGVGGATPQEVLDDPRTTLVTGDGTAGIHRRAEDADAEERPQDYTDRPIPEAYCWSGLTSGNAARALWLILLPFMVANLAYWMRPAAPLEKWSQRVYSALARLIALSLTVLLTAAVCEIALDLVAWQCAGAAGCAQNSSWLSFLAADSGGWWSEPGRRLVVASLLPLAVTVLLWWLSHRTWSAYESASPPPRTPGAVRVTPGEEPPPLSLPGFWYGRRLVSRLRAAHTAAGLLTLTTALQLATLQHDVDSSGSGALGVLGQLLLVLCAAGWLVVLAVVVRRGRTEQEPDERVDRGATKVLPTAAALVLALTATHTAWGRPGWESAGKLPGAGIFVTLALVQGALIAALAVTALMLQRHALAGHRSAMGGLGGAAVALIGCGLGGVLSGGLAQRVSEWLASGSSAGTSELIAGPPVVLIWQAAVIPPLAVVTVLFALVSVVRVLRLRQALTPRIVDGYPDETTELRSRSARIAGSIARAGVTDSAPVLIGAITVLSLVLGAGAVTGAMLTGKPPGEAAQGAAAPLPALGDLTQGIGSWLMGGLVIALIAMGRLAYRDQSARRTVGILWDVGTFWPRAAHPFAPPCYAERAVPDLTWRMGTWTEMTGGRLVISGHSQGSVLAAAAVWQLDHATRSRVVLLTYGSPLERLYGRWFPEAFGPSALRALHREVEGWRNLWRLTDPIGGPVLLDEAAHGESRPPEGPTPEAELAAEQRQDGDSTVRKGSDGTQRAASTSRTASDSTASDSTVGATNSSATTAKASPMKVSTAAKEQAEPPSACGSDVVDCGPLRDPLYYGRTLRHPLPSPILGHSDYQADPAFEEQRAALLASVSRDRREGGEVQPQETTRVAKVPGQGRSGRSSG